MRRDLLLKNKFEIPTQEDNTSTFVSVLTAIYMYLFVIMLAIFMAINAMANNWEKDIAGSITVQVTTIENDNKHIDDVKTKEQLNKVLQFMERISGVESVQVLDDQVVEKLMSPWIGNKVDLSTLPIPRLLDVKLKPNAELNYDEITRGLRLLTANASIDNHRLWLNRLIKFATSLKTVALAILLMVVAICAFSVYYSARTSLNINMNSIEILHIIGAKDDYIAKLYAKNYAKIGFFAGVIGLMAAVPCIILVGKYGISTGSGLLNGAGLSTTAWGLIMLTPLFSLLYSMVTSYFAVLKSLEKMV
ncbi:MAG: hypothetical protein IJ824_03010 [Alphaproteobacteria bacterium]|nr:hypothetical protein [Alphaproteobacteria bacterium]